MNVIETQLPEVKILEPRVFPDERGQFLELWNERTFKHKGLPTQFAQDNLSVSRRGVLRGLHFQHPNDQGKLVSVLSGEIFDVAVDIRLGSPRFGKSISVVLSSDNHRQIFIPEGFAHGFVVLSESATVLYKATDFYSPQSESTLRWDDASVGIQWPAVDLIISGKDREGLKLTDFPEQRLPRMV